MRVTIQNLATGRFIRAQGDGIAGADYTWKVDSIGGPAEALQRLIDLREAALAAAQRRLQHMRDAHAHAHMVQHDDARAAEG